MKMGRRLRCSSVTYQSRYAPSSRPAAAGPTAHFDRNESHVIMGQDTSPACRLWPATAPT